MVTQSVGDPAMPVLFSETNVIMSSKNCTAQCIAYYRHILRDRRHITKDFNV